MAPPQIALSVIVPVYNGGQTLKMCLGGIFASNYKDFEVIIVDDSSNDNSVEIAKLFPCRILQTGRNLGPGRARNLGAERSRGEILVFVDSDVVIKKETFDIILNSFKRDPGIDAVIGYFSLEHPHRNFFSQYKNVYMNFIFSGLPAYIDFLFTALCAIKKASYLEFCADRSKAEDTALGQRFKMSGKKIYLPQELQAVHLKKYSFISFIKNDFMIPYHWAKLFLRYRGLNDIFRKKRFAHAKLGQILSVVASCLILISAMGLMLWPPALPLTLAMILIFFILNFRFFLFLYKVNGVTFVLKSTVISYLDTLTMGLGIAAGSVSYFFEILKSGSPIISNG